MAKSRDLTHQIARLLLLAFCISLLTAISSSFTPQPVLARTAHIVQGPGDMGGALESKPDQWGAPERQFMPTTHLDGWTAAPAPRLTRSLFLLVADLLLGWM